MAFDAHVLKVFIASPGDTSEERDAVSEALQGWNAARAEKEQVVLFPWRWEKHAVPALGGTAQGVINEQAVDSSDIVIAIFDSRLGQETDNAVSGTAEEIERAHEAGKPVHVWFSTEDLPRDVDPKQLVRLDSFKKELGQQGLLGEYASPADLAYKVRDAIENDVTALGLGAVAPITKAGEHAIPVVRFTSRREQTGVDPKGKPKFRTSERILVENKSQNVTAEDLTIDFGELAPYVMGDASEPFDLHPLTDMHWIAALDMGAPFAGDVVIRWNDNDKPHEKKQRLSLSP